jgi:DNA mismatch endonuclease (patch repair protein)
MACRGDVGLLRRGDLMMERSLRNKLVNGSFGTVSPAHSRRMGAIRGRGNRTTEARFRAMLVRAGIRGWTMGTNKIKGKPDFYFPKYKVAVFLDGCFWHGCPRCGHVATVNRPFWKAKIERNRQRDLATEELVSGSGVRSIRFWEHDLRDSAETCMQRIRDLLVARRNRSRHGRRRCRSTHL